MELSGVFQLPRFSDIADIYRKWFLDLETGLVLNQRMCWDSFN